MADDLSEYPDFGPEPRMPWDEPLPTVLWQWGADKGRALRDIDSKELSRKRRWLEEKQGAGHYFQKLLDEIEAVLTERGGL